MGVADEAADEIARRSRGTPRVANRILRRVRDVAEVRHEGVVTPEIAHEALELLEVDEHGLERADRALLEAIVGQVRRRPGRAVDAGGRARRGAGHDRGRLRALPAPARVHPAHAARPDRHRARPRARGRRRCRPAHGRGRAPLRCLSSGFPARPSPRRRVRRAHPRPDRALRQGPAGRRGAGRDRAAGRIRAPARVHPPGARLRLRHAQAARTPSRRRS